MKGKIMKYTHPEISVLGDAAQLIQNFTKANPIVSDPVDPMSSQNLNPAYDLDE